MQDYYEYMEKNVLSNWSFTATLAISVLAVIASLLGLFTAAPYANETENWTLQGRGQDTGNLLAAVVLLASAVWAQKGSLVAYRIWLGAVWYMLYAYIIYAVAVHFNGLFLVYVAIIGMTFYLTLFALRGSYAPPPISRFASYTLITTGVLFGLLWLKEILPALASGGVPLSIKEAGLGVNPVHVIDLSVVLPGMIATGYYSLKGRAPARHLVAAWLSFSVLMGTSIVVTMILMSREGYENTLQPMVMVGLLVLVSGVALGRQSTLQEKV